MTYAKDREAITPKGRQLTGVFSGEPTGPAKRPSWCRPTRMRHAKKKGGFISIT